MLGTRSQLILQLIKEQTMSIPRSVLFFVTIFLTIENSHSLEEFEWRIHNTPFINLQIM